MNKVSKMSKEDEEALTYLLKYKAPLLKDNLCEEALINVCLIQWILKVILVLMFIYFCFHDVFARFTSVLIWFVLEL